MSSIHVRFAAAGLAPAARAAFAEGVRSRTVQLPGEPVHEIGGECGVGIAVNHGQLPSGGTAVLDSSFVVLAGSIWDGNGAAALADPAGVLAAWNSRPGSRRLLWTGVFALAHCDAASRTLTVVCDRFGALPVYWRERDGIVTISTELKVLAEPGREALDEVAFDEFMAMGYLLGSHTLLAGVHRLPAHHALVCSPAGTRVERLPDPGAPRDRPADDEALDEFDAMVGRTLGRFAASVPSWNIAMSGGLDSRLVAGAALRCDRPLTGFTAGVPDSLEVDVARQVTRHLGFPLQTHEIDGRLLPDWFGRAVWFTEGRCLPNHMHYIGANLADKVPHGLLLHGLIGEGIMGGYGDDLDLLDASPERRRENCFATTHGAFNWTPDLRKAAFSSARDERLAGGVRRVCEDLWGQQGFNGSYGDTLEFKFRIRAVGMTVPNLISQVLPWSDVASPFLDRDIYEFCNTLDAKALAGRQLQLRWAMRHFPATTELPRLKDGILIPVKPGIPGAYDEALKRHWRGVNTKYYLCRVSGGRINLPHRGSFPFYGQWYRRWKHVRDYVDGIVLSERCLDRGLWRREGVQELARSLRRGKNSWNALGTILLVELLIRQFIEGTDRPRDPVTPRGLGR